ncbi:hypothetical protein L7F22_026821 [Adiantum nelumboides]|nr:hypothetical protein [Adiantum nelumboides]
MQDTLSYSTRPLWTSRRPGNAAHTPAFSQRASRRCRRLSAAWLASQDHDTAALGRHAAQHRARPARDPVARAVGRRRPVPRPRVHPQHDGQSKGGVGRRGAAVASGMTDGAARTSPTPSTRPASPPGRPRSSTGRTRADTAPQRRRIHPGKRAAPGNDRVHVRGWRGVRMPAC